MTTRPKLIFRIEDSVSFNEGWILPLVEPWFEMTVWDPAASYSSDCAVLTTYQQDFEPNAWFRGLEQQGLKIIVDHLYDSDVDTQSFRINDQKLDLRSPHWMWYRSAVMSSHFGYDQYRPQRDYTHDFLCLMNKVRDHRDRVQQELVPELAQARWSYVDRGIAIGDPQERETQVFWEYYVNPEWYDSTCWHLVVESWMRTDRYWASPTYPNYQTEISEKSYKPLAYFQPFVIMGSQHTLKFLHSQGFETWDNLWSESYDSVASDCQRANTVLAQVRDMVRTYNRHFPGWDTITEQKLAHNHARFFDQALVRSRFTDEIIGDIQEFLGL